MLYREWKGKRAQSFLAGLTWHGDTLCRRGKQNLAKIGPRHWVPQNGGLQRGGNFASLLELPQEKSDLPKNRVEESRT